MFRFSSVALVLISFLATDLARAGRFSEAPLGPPPSRIHGVREVSSPIHRAGPAISNLKAAMAVQTPVKSQGSRGTCSIFSSIAALESILKTKVRSDVDLSENYLQYLVMTRVKTYPSEGSDTEWNIPAISSYGAITEAQWPYEQYDWTSSSIPASEKTTASRTCGHLKGNTLKACLLGHMDPGNDRFANAAQSFSQKYALNRLNYRILDTSVDIKAALDQRKPVILGVQFFYKAWNHRLMSDIGLGTRDMSAWSSGVVSAPTEEDKSASYKKPAGHSVLVIGYNDQKRVYYFKNSWGTDSFGVTTTLPGYGKAPGYGEIAYDYAHEYGTFASVQLN